MSTIEQFAKLISTANRINQHDAIAFSRVAFIDTIACMFAGAASEITERALQSVISWGPGDSAVIGRKEKLNPPFAAMVNGASAHAFDYDDFDLPANAHPSAVIFPALLALAAERSVSGLDILDAHIVGVEVIQRLGEAMNMNHYRRGWLSTLTLGSVGATAACARLCRFDHATAVAALSLSASMASGLINQGGFLAKQLHPGLAAKNGVMACAFAAAGITASAQAIDGPISLANTMGDYHPEKFDLAMAKLGDPWSITEYGLIMKAYPSCGYTHRVIDAAIDIHHRLGTDTENIRSVKISVPDYFLDLLVYSNPNSAAQAMFSAEYSVAFAMVHGDFGFAALKDNAITDPELTRLCNLTRVLPRAPRNPDITLDPKDPDFVEVQLNDGNTYRSDIPSPVGSPANPMSETRLRAKFDACLESHGDLVDCNDIWTLLSQIDQLEDANLLTERLSSGLEGSTYNGGTLASSFNSVS